MASSQDAYDCFVLYNAIKLHFETDKYDCIKFNYKTRVNAKSFFKRRDKYFFDKVAKRHGKDVRRFLVSNFINEVSYIGEMLDDKGERNYNDMIKRHESLSYTFKGDMSMLSDQYDYFDDLLLTPEGQHPAIVKEYMQGNICLETIVMVNKLTQFMSKADKEITETISWPEISRKIHKYSPFVNGDINIIRKTIMKSFTQ